MEPFRFDAQSSVDGDGAENVLVHGDNLDVLRWLGPSFRGRFRCVYLDPPYNSGRVYADYTDRWSADAWPEMMRPRLAALALMLDDGGALVAQIDDNELGRLTLLLDEALGRRNRVGVVTVVRSAGTGHKAINRGPVNVAEYLLLYTKNRDCWRPNALKKARDEFDFSYQTFLLNEGDAPSAWRFCPLSLRVANELGHTTTRAATAAIGARRFRLELVSFALAHARSVVRFAQPRYDAVSVAARALIDRSRGEPDAVFVLQRVRFKPLILRGGNRILFLADKVQTFDGEARIVEPLTNVWDDVPYQGIAREGGIAYVRNKKPERLLERVIALCTDPGDWVLDPFLGSGTTAAVAMKMGRRWVGIENGSAFDRLALPRLQAVVAGDPTGISRAVGFRGGGAFATYR